MKWLSYFSTAAIILFAGYWLGANKHTESQHYKPEQNSNTNVEKLSINQERTAKSSLSAKTNKEPSSPITHKNISDNLTKIFLQHLENQDYATATRLLTDTLNNSPLNSPTLKPLYIAHIQQLLSQPQKNNERISNAIQIYLGDFYDDTEVLLLLAKHYALSNNFYDMLNTVQLAESYAYTNEQKKIIGAAYSEFIRYADKRLVEQRKWQTLIGVYVHSENTGLLREQDTLRLAELYMEQGNTYLAVDYAEKLAGKPQWKEQLDALLPAPKTEESSLPIEKASINLQKIADQFIITTQLSGNDTNLLIDTGASITTVSTKYFTSIKQRSHFSYQQKQTFLTANGKTSGEIYTVDTFQIGQYLLTDIEIAVIDFPTSQHSSGLLGMNVLRNFTFAIDQVNALLTLEKASP